MPVIIDKGLPATFAQDRAAIISLARERAGGHVKQLREAARWLAKDFSEKSVRAKHAATLKLRQAQVRGSMSPSEGKLVQVDWKKFELPRGKILVHRLEAALFWLAGENRRDDMGRLLGPNMPEDQRLKNAMRCVVVCGCVLDPDAKAWLGKATDLADTSWTSTRKDDRAGVCQRWGAEALRLMREACACLGWVQVQDQMPAPAMPVPKHASDDGQHRFDLMVQARAFRHAGQPVYPGRILVERDGTFASPPVDDDAFDPSTERILGIAMWGPRDEWYPGYAKFEEGEKGRSVPMIAGDMDRPTTGIPLVDTWIARADALRGLLRGTVTTVGGPALTALQLRASAEEVVRLVRETALALIARAPAATRPTLLALSAVADAEMPTDIQISTAIQELLVAAQQWKKSPRPDDPAVGGNSHRSAEPRIDSGSGSPGTRRRGWTRQQLIDATAPAKIGGTTFDRVRDKAEIRAGKKGREFTEQEVRRMMAVAYDEAPQEADRIVAAWSKLLDSRP